MKPREVLHELVDKLPESELGTAARILKSLGIETNRNGHPKRNRRPVAA